MSCSNIPPPKLTECQPVRSFYEYHKEAQSFYEWQLHYKMHQRINDRAFMHANYKAKRGFTLGMLVNALIYRMSDTADDLLIRL